MIERVITKLNTPWRVIGLGGTDHDCWPGEGQDFAFDVVDADGNLICETDNKEMAEVITELPNMYYRLQAIAQMQPAIVYRIGGEEVECPRCVDLIRGGKEMMHRLGVDYDDKTAY